MHNLSVCWIGFDFDICPCTISVFLSWISITTDLNSLLRTWVLMSCQSVCRTSIKASLNASQPSSKVQLYSDEEWTLEIYHRCYTGCDIFFVPRFVGSCGERYGWSREVHDDSSLQGSLLSWDHGRWEERPGHSEENQVSKTKVVIIFKLATLVVINLFTFPLSIG